MSKVPIPVVSFFGLLGSRSWLKPKKRKIETVIKTLGLAKSQQSVFPKKLNVFF